MAAGKHRTNVQEVRCGQRTRHLVVVARQPTVGGGCGGSLCGRRRRSPTVASTVARPPRWTISRSCGGVLRSTRSLPRWRWASAATAASKGGVRSGSREDSDDVPLVRRCAALIAVDTALATGTLVTARGRSLVARRLAATLLRQGGGPSPVDGRHDLQRGAARLTVHPLGDIGGEFFPFDPPLPVHHVVRASGTCGARAHACVPRKVHRERRTLLAPLPVSAVTEARSPSPVPPPPLLPNSPLQPCPPLPPCPRPAARAAPAEGGRRSSSHPPPQRLASSPRELTLAAAAAVRATVAPAAAGGGRSGSGVGGRGGRGTRGGGVRPPMWPLVRRKRAFGE